MISRKFFFTIGLLALFFLCAGVLLLYYRGELERNVDWNDSVRIDRESRLPTSVFSLARRAGFLKTFKGEQGELFIEPPPCEEILLKRTHADKNRLNVLTVLCTSPQGEEVRNEIDAWNASYDLVAVRDNQSQNEDCEREPLTAKIFVPRECKVNTWRAERLLQDRAVAINWLPRAEPPPDEFFMLVDLDEPTLFSGDWAMLRSDQSSAGQRPRFRLSNSIVIPPSNGTVTIGVAGRLRKVSIEGTNSPGYVVDPAKPETPRAGMRIGDARVHVYLHCGSIPELLEDEVEEDDEKDVDECKQEPASELRAAVAYELQISFASEAARRKRRTSDEDRTLKVVIEVEPIENFPKNLRVRTRSDRFAIARTRHLHASCSLAFHDSGEACELAWMRAGGSEQRAPREYHIALSDRKGGGVNLVHPDTGIISPEAFESGLAPIIGLGPQDWGSLISSMARQQIRRDPDGKALPLVPVALTVDSRIQRAAQRAINASSKDCQSRRSERRGRQAQRLPECIRLRNDQSATLVLMDAGASAGEIRAVASWPPMPKHLHLWDLQSLEHIESGFGGIGWRLTSGQQRPGSSFKAITSLAAMAAVASSGNTQLMSLLSGRMELREQENFLRLARNADRKSVRCSIGNGSPNTIPVPNSQRPNWCARNYNWGEYWRPSDPKVTGCPAARGGALRQFGMCEALMISSNLFFGGISWRLTEKSLNAPAPNLTIAQIAHRVTFGELPRDGQGSKPLVAPRFDLTRGTAPHAFKLLADPIQFDFGDHNAALGNLPALVRAGFGDGAASTPLAMATAYASIARGQTVRPSIVPLPRDASGCPTNKTALECESLVPEWAKVESIFPHLKAGLHAVAASSQGTASFFGSERGLLKRPDGQARLFVKTGTATTSMRPTRFALWLVGWIEGVEGTGIPDRLAFSCMITRGRGSETGGGTCGRLMRSLLAELNRTDGGR